MNVTTILERDQILNLCELIHTSHSGNLSRSRISRLGVVPLYPGHFVNAQTQSHSGIAGRHPHSFPIHHLESDYGLHSLDRRGPPSLGARHGRSSTQIRQYIIDGSLGALLVMARAPLGCDWGKHHTTGVTCRWPAPWPGTLPGSPHPCRVVCMMQRSSRNPDSSRHLMQRRIVETKATPD